MTALCQVAFDATCSQVFMNRHGKFTCGNDTLTAFAPVGGPLATVRAKRVLRPPIPGLKRSLSGTFPGTAMGSRKK